MKYLLPLTAVLLLVGCVSSVQCPTTCAAAAYELEEFYRCPHSEHRAEWDSSNELMYCHCVEDDE